MSDLAPAYALERPDFTGRVRAIWALEMVEALRRTGLFDVIEEIPESDFWAARSYGV